VNRETRRSCIDELHSKYTLTIRLESMAVAKHCNLKAVPRRASRSGL